MDLFWWVIIAVTAFVAIVALNIYNAYKSGYLKSFQGWLVRRTKSVMKENWKYILVVLVWSLIVAILMMKSYWLVYQRDPRAYAAGIAYSDVSRWMPRLETYDYVIIVIAAFISGFLIVDIQKILAAMVANVALTFTFAMIYISGFLWWVLAWNQNPVIGNWWQIGWQYTFYVSFLLTARMSFPTVQIISFMAIFVGGIIHAMLNPSAENGS